VSVVRFTLSQRECNCSGKRLQWSSG
jgi:hypothetical protein